MFVIEVPFASPAYDDCLALRDEILRKPLGLEFKIKDLEQEYNSFHLNCYDDNHVLQACLVLKPLEEGIVKMRQVAVKVGAQNKGIGRLMVEASEVFARKKGFQLLELNARDTAIPFYLKLDYKKVGKPFTEVGIKHHKMEKVL